ncbi:hypothetical protein BDW22DRAFT_1428772 [Trametopsis cervina]|nr:hypothetical protein BDW22DRAFT_1428772 [Trametopsis cervina]
MSFLTSCLPRLRWRRPHAPSAVSFDAVSFESTPRVSFTQFTNLADSVQFSLTMYFDKPLIVHHPGPRAPLGSYVQLVVTDTGGHPDLPITYVVKNKPASPVYTKLLVELVELKGGRQFAHGQRGVIVGVRACEKEWVEFVVEYENGSRSDNLLVWHAHADLTGYEQHVRALTPNLTDRARSIPASVWDLRMDLTGESRAFPADPVARAVELLRHAGAQATAHDDGSWTIHPLVSCIKFVDEDADVVKRGAHGTGATISGDSEGHEGIPYTDTVD